VKVTLSERLALPSGFAVPYHFSQVVLLLDILECRNDFQDVQACHLALKGLNTKNKSKDESAHKILNICY